MRLSGFATGMDINQMVQDLMRAERMPMDKMKQDQQRMEWRVAEYRAINLKLDQFRTNIFDTVLRRASMMANKATSSNEQLVTATATSSASAGTFRISEVERLATAASNASSDAITDGSKLDMTKRLGEQSFADDSFWQQGIVNREVITVNEKNTTLSLNRELGNPDSVVVKVNGVSYKVVEEFGDGSLRATQVMIQQDSEGNDELVFGQELARGQHVELTTITADENGSDQFAVSSITTVNANGDEVTDTFVFTADQSINQVIQQMNASSTGINVFYDEFSDKMSVIRKDTGQFNMGSGPEMVFEGGLFEHGFKLNSNNERGGENAKFTINGLETERQSNTFIMNGVSIGLQGTFTEGQSVTIDTSKNVDSIFDTISGFIEEYNELIDLVNGKMKEDFHRDYLPLTDEQRREMSDSEIERWEERAMSGMLRNDNVLRNGFNQFRIDMYSPVTLNFDGAFNQLTAIGITTTNDYLQGGKLEINEDKLREAIEKDPEAVFQLFAGDGSTNGEQGIARRVRESANGLIEQISQRAGGLRGRNLNHQFSIGREMDRIDDRLSNFERRMQQVESRYWAQFTAMEKAVAQANSQGEALFAQLYGGQF